MKPFEETAEVSHGEEFWTRGFNDAFQRHLSHVYCTSSGALVYLSRHLLEYTNYVTVFYKNAYLYSRGPNNFVYLQPKVYSCCIPTCSTRGPVTNFRFFPPNSYIRKKWMAAIPHLETVIDHRSVICQEHFMSRDPDAPPSVFKSKSIKNVPQKRKWFPSYMFELPGNDLDMSEVNISYVYESFIVNFINLKLCYENMLGELLKQWQVKFTDAHVIFYKLCLDDIAKIKCSIKITSDLLVEVTLGERIMDPLDLTWILPPTSKIVRWSQLKLLLLEFSMHNKNTDSVVESNENIINQ